ncbi:hypothetical protein BPIT_31430 [Candidatus Brocadia pituitae]|nr:hypothetical protein BPIT_31430 [Candidatus Brocadia pituitae]
MKAVRSDKVNIKIYYNFGIAYTKVRKLDNAIWQKALTINLESHLNIDIFILNHNFATLYEFHQSNFSIKK